MSKMPAFQFYPADWRKDPGVQSLSWADRGVWIEIICLMHESPRRGVLLMPSGAPMTSTSLARIIGLPLKQTNSCVERLIASGVASREEESGALVNRRMVRDERIRQVRTEAGRLGGNPNLVKQNQTNMDNQDNNQKSTPSSSSSSSSSKQGEPPKPPDPILQLGEFGRARMTDEQHAKLKSKLNGHSEDFIRQFDEWVQQAPEAKHNGVKRKDRDPYSSILSWYDRAVKRGDIRKKDGDIHV